MASTTPQRSDFMSTARTLIAAAAVFALAGCGGGSTGSATQTTTPVPTPPVTPTQPTTPPVTPTLPQTPAATSLNLTSPAFNEGALMPVDYSCDGGGVSPPLSWNGAPSGTSAYVLIMHTVAPDGTKWNWLLYNIDKSVTALQQATSGVGTAGSNSDGPNLGYAPPCSQGPGLKTYTFTLYALSGPVDVGPTPRSVTRATLLAAMASKTLAIASLSAGYDRTNSGAISRITGCTAIMASTSRYDQKVGVTCDNTFAYLASNGLPAHPMMNGITATNQQVPISQNFVGNNRWKIPLNPVAASNHVSVVDGPVGIAVNGVPIFNPYKQGGVGDTKALGELDICNGHAGRADDYHYHAAPVCIMSEFDSNRAPVGWALDGYPIWGFRNPDGATVTYDDCGGQSDSSGQYRYHVRETLPYVVGCFHGQADLSLIPTTTPIRPPGDPLAVSSLALVDDFGWQKMSYVAGATTRSIRYRQSATENCWDFEIVGANGALQAQTYCRR